MTKSILITALALIILSCNEEKKEPSKSDYEIRWEKQKQLDTLNLNRAYQFASKYNASFGWDTTLNFTYFLQEQFENTNQPVSFIGEVKDVLKNDTSFVLKIASTNSISYHSFIAEVSVSPSLFKEMQPLLKASESNEGCFIFNTTKITSNQPILKSEIESNGQNVEDATSYLTLDFDENLVKFKGKLIAYYLYERLNKDDE